MAVGLKFGELAASMSVGTLTRGFSLTQSRLRNPSYALLTKSFSSKTTHNKKLKFLVIDGYAKEGRAELEGGGATTAGCRLLLS